MDSPELSIRSFQKSVTDLTDFLLQMGGLECVPQKVQGNLWLEGTITRNKRL